MKFSPFIERGPDDPVNHRSSLHHICFRHPNFSPEELRLADYSTGLRHANVPFNGLLRASSNGSTDQIPLATIRSSSQLPAKLVVPNVKESCFANNFQQPDHGSTENSVEVSNPPIISAETTFTRSPGPFVEQEALCATAPSPELSRSTSDSTIATVNRQDVTLTSQSILPDDSSLGPFSSISHSDGVNLAATDALVAKLSHTEYREAKSQPYTGFTQDFAIKGVVVDPNNKASNAAESASVTDALPSHEIDHNTNLQWHERTVDVTELPETERVDPGVYEISNLPAPQSDKRVLVGADLPEAKRMDTGTTKSSHKHPRPVIPLKRKASEDGEELVSKRVDTGIGKSLGSAPISQVFERSDCASCGDTYAIHLLQSTPCGHRYCRECICTLVRLSLADEQSFPPRCCKQPFGIDEVKQFLTPELISEYGEKKQEYATASRIYCSDARCSALLHPINISDQDKTGVCPHCFVVTCTICKGAEHVGECPKDEDIQKVMELAEREGWKSCPTCGRVIELKVSGPPSLPGK